METQPWPTPFGAIGQPLPAFNPGSAAAPSEPVPDSFSFAKPMQWTPDRNAGFSGSDPARLYLPLIMDPIYGYQALNVEAQERNGGSLLHWTKRMIRSGSGIRSSGGVVFPSIGELTYLLTLPGHGFYWFLLPPAAPQR